MTTRVPSPSPESGARDGASVAVYVLLGAVTGFVFGLMALSRPESAALGMWAPLIGSVAGGMSAGGLKLNRGLKAYGPAGELLRWISAFAFTGLVIAVLASVFGAISFGAVPGAVGLAMVAGLGFGIKMQQHTVFGGEGKRTRTPPEIADLWTLIVVTLAIAGLLAMLSLKLMQSAPAV